MSSPEIPPEIIDMNRIRMEPVDSTSNDLEIRYYDDQKLEQTTDQKTKTDLKTDKAKPYLFLNLTFYGAGINVIEEIKKGRILFHKIVVRDSSGRVLGEEPINFQATKMSTTRIQKSESDVYISNDNERIPLSEEEKSKDVIRRSYTMRSFTENDKVPQVIRLRELPDPNSYVSVYVVIYLVEPVLKEVCRQIDGNSCPVVDYYTFREIREELNSLMQEIRRAYERQEDIPAFALKEPTDSYRSQMKQNLDDLNTRFHLPPNDIKVINLANSTANLYSNVANFGSRVYYREWKLLSEPTYFRVKVSQKSIK